MGSSFRGGLVGGLSMNSCRKSRVMEDPSPKKVLLGKGFAKNTIQFFSDIWISKMAQKATCSKSNCSHCPLHCTRISFTILIPASQPIWPAGRFWHLWPAGRFGVIWPAGRLGKIWPAGRLAIPWPAGWFGIPWPLGRNVMTKEEFF